jgi:DNA-binding NarL/FixJ family response regulator
MPRRPDRVGIYRDGGIDRLAVGSHHIGVISVYFVEDDPSHAREFERAIAAATDLSCIGCAGTAARAIQDLQALRPDVLMVDLGLPDGSGLEVIRFARARCPYTEIMVISMFGDEDSLIEAIRAGATGYLLKDALPGDFVASIRDLRAGHSPISPVLARYLLNAYRPGAQPQPDPGHASDSRALSEREREVLHCVARGMTFAEIARHAFISQHTVATHVKNIYRKLEAHSKSEAVYLARQRRLLD